MQPHALNPPARIERFHLGIGYTARIWCAKKGEGTVQQHTESDVTMRAAHHRRPGWVDAMPGMQTHRPGHSQVRNATELAGQESVTVGTFPGGRRQTTLG